MTTLLRLALLIPPLALLSCTSDRIENPWINPRPADVASDRWQQLPAPRFREVVSEARAEAVRMLATEPVQRLPGRDVQRFVPAGLPEQPSGRFYLLRAVRMTQSSGCDVLVRGRAVTVRCSAPGAASAVVQSAVVADLEQPPERVYVEVSAAQ